MWGKHTKSHPIYKVLKQQIAAVNRSFRYILENAISLYLYRMKLRRLLYFNLLLLLSAVNTSGQVSFSIQTSSPEIYKNDVLQVAYVVTNVEDISNFVPPVFKSWNVAAGPMESQETSVINGKSTSKRSFVYMLVPQKTGMVALPGASLTANNHTLVCKPVTINVLNKNNPVPGQMAPPPPSTLQSLFDPQEGGGSDEHFGKIPELREHEDASEKIKELSFIKVTSSKSSCYVGEPVLVTYKLYRATRSRAVIERQPAFTGCSVKEITFDEQSTVEQYQGHRYIVNIIRKVQLQPLQSGTLKLNSATVLNEIAFLLPHKKYNEEKFKALIQNKPGSIEVMPLPKQHKPEDFSGVTGSFTIKAKAKENNIPAQENNSLLLTISGKGNLTDIKPPAVKWPDSTEHFEAVTEDNINQTLFPTEGTRTFAYHFVANKEGEVIIPPIRFSYFNVEKGKYETLTTESVRFQFTKPSGKKHYAVKEDGGSFRYGWVVLLALIAGSLGWYYYKQHTAAMAAAKAKTPATPPAPAAPQPTVNFMIAFEMLLQIEDHYLFFNKSKEILEQAISTKTNTWQVPFGVLLQALVHHSEYGHMAEACKQLHEECDVAMYSPGMDSSDRTLVLDKMKQLLQQFNLLPA